MKHVFIINPAAGASDCEKKVRSELNALGGDFPYECYRTTAKEDATLFVRRWCASHPGERVRFYACGGDGTIGEVAAGVLGMQQASMSCYPAGSGNDYVKYYGGKEHFQDLRALVHGEERKIDLLQVGTRIAVNAVHFGFDSVVASTMDRVRRMHVLGGRHAYVTGVAHALLTGMRTVCRVTADGENLNPDGRLLLCTLANGTHVGGSYRCAPRSWNDDGYMEVCLVRPVSRLTFLRLKGAYREGSHLEDARFTDRIVYRRARKALISAGPGFRLCLDGELAYGDTCSVEVLPGAVSFAVPQGAVCAQS